MKPGPRKWVVFDGQEIIGRVYGCDFEQGTKLARQVFPELEETLTIKLWDLVSFKDRVAAKQLQLITPEIAGKIANVSA